MIDHKDKNPNTAGQKGESTSKFHTMLSVILAITFFGAFLFTSYGILERDAKYKDTAEANEKIIAELREELSKNNNQEIKEEQEIKEVLNSAAKLGVEVANYQNAYRELNVTTQGDMIKENAEKLDICFSENSKNARTPWYSLKNSKIDYTWEFMSTYSFTDDMADVIWLAKDKTDLNHNGKIYAYAIGKYDAKNNIFTDMQWRQTYLGARNVDPTVTSFKPIRPEEVNQLVTDLNSIEVEGREQTDEELRSIREAQELMRQRQQNNQN